METDNILIQYPTFRFGDHIKVRRLYGVYSHHGVYIGNSNVLHLTGDPKRGVPVLSYGEGMASVKIDNISDFENGSKALVVKCAPRDLDKSLFICETTDLLGKDKYYNLILHNCEHFANQITDNGEKSDQVRSAWYASSIGGVSSMIGVYTLHTLSGSIIIPICITTLSFLGMQYL